MSNLMELRAATIAAIKRTADQHIATQVKAGKIQVVRAVPKKNGLFTVTPVSDYLPIQDAIKFLGEMK